MKKVFVKGAVLAVAGVGLMAGSALADIVNLTDVTIFTPTGTVASEDYVGHGYGNVNFLDGSGDYVTWYHNFEFDPALDSILSATLTVKLWDDERDTWNPQTLDLGFGVAEGGGWAFGEVNSRAYSYDMNLSVLDDGKLFVKVGSLLGDFGIESSQLDITYNTAPVPEPATMLLFGAGLAGLAGVSRRRSKK